MPEIRKDIDGWFDYSKFYDEMVGKFPRGHFVEVGCWFGRSAVYLLEKIKEDNTGAVVDFVDNWCGDLDVPYQQALFERNGPDFVYESFLKNIHSADPDYAGKVIRGDSTLSASEYEDESLDFVFLDANHSYEKTKADIEAWFPKVKVGGVLAGHDYEFDPTSRAVFDTLGRLPEKPNHVWYFEKILWD